MTEQTPIGNSFRRAVLTGERRALVVGEKKPKLVRTESDDLDMGIVPRTEIRRGDHREGDRHRLHDETAIARFDGADHTVEVVNLSGGGAMIRTETAPTLWQIIELELGGGMTVDAAVRWIRGQLVGLEFAHETKIDCDPEQRARLLLSVIQRSFPDSPVELALPAEPDAPEDYVQEEEDLGARSEIRHSLVWKGQILYQFDSEPARLRNVSSGGALVDVAINYPVGAEVMLDLDEAGHYSAVVAWAAGDQVGLRFKEEFDVDCLEKARPDFTAHRWEKPDFLRGRDNEDDEEWEQSWKRGSIDELKTHLEGFLKR